MKRILMNDDNLNDDEINEIITRVKIFLINDNNEIILAFSNNKYYFPGGHLEDGETLNECIIREIKEETGIELPNKDYLPFAMIDRYTKNYHNSGKNRNSRIFYYYIKNNLPININNINLTEEEIKNNFTIKVIKYDNIKSELLKCKDNNLNDYGVYDEMINAINLFDEQRKE